MAFNRFRLNIIFRSILLGLTALLFFYILYNHYIISALFILLLFGLQIFLLVRVVDKTNRDLSRFLNSIQFNDFSQNFNEKNLSPSFNELHTSFNNIIKEFRKTRSEMEEHFQYLQTVVRHVSTGLISFNRNGDIELINEAAKELLGIDNIINIKQLNAVSSDLAETIVSKNRGRKPLVTVNINSEMRQISVSAADFKMRGKDYTLVSLQDITSELENERLNNEMDIARVLQKKLLPVKFPDVPGYSLSAECLPASEVGGDYFDFIRLDENRIGIVIADVSGKGLPAAFYMTLAKGIFQSYAAGSGSPKEVLIKMNSLIWRTIEKRSFITMTYAVLDFKSNKIIIARAGHEPAVLVSSDSNVRMIKPKGIGLGLEPGEMFSKSLIEEETEFKQGDSLILYTDGLTDAKDLNNNDFGTDGLIKVIRKFRNDNSDIFSHTLLGEIKAFRGNAPQFDDITIISITRNPS